MRGVPTSFQLKLNGKSLCLLGENGSGKTTVSDSIELWSSGDVRAYHREGYGLDAVVNVDAEQAIVTVEVSGMPALRRTLRGTTASTLEPAGPAPLDPPSPPPVPMLRHATMADFMRMSAGEKKKAFLDLLGLAPLSDFRDTLKTVANNAKTRRQDAERLEREEQAALGQHTNDGDPVAVAEDLRQRASLTNPVQTHNDLLTLPVDAGHISDEPDRVGALDELARAVEALGDDPSRSWNTAVADQAVRTNEALTALIASGQRVLPDWHEASCPLCLRPMATEELSDELARRAAKLGKAQAEFRARQEELGDYISRIERFATSLAAVERLAPKAGWPEGERLAEAREKLVEHAAELKTARSQVSPAPAAPQLDLGDLFPRLREVAEKGKRSSQAQALVDLARLRDQAKRVASASHRAKRAKSIDQAVHRFLKIAEAEIQAAIEAALGRIGELTADYYGRLMVGTPYTDVQLSYQSKRSGGVEFSLLFDRRHPISPPQRIMSESQLNALGLALFLARLKVEDQPWRAVVLDDVVNAFDAPHRQGLIRVLADEFADWQVILLTHDPGLFAITRKTVSGWLWEEIVGWTPQGGPVLGSGDPVKRLRERLDAGDSASELGGLARRALEQSLALPVEKLGYEIRYDPHQRHTGYAFLRALRRGLKQNKSPITALPIFQRMEGANYMASLGAHHRPDAPAVTRDDLYRLVEDLEGLAQVFVCQSCDQPVWAAEVKGKHQCRCSGLAA